MKKISLFLALAFSGSLAFAQESKPLEISGSADLYAKYDFANRANINTSFATDNNSFSLGMLDISLKKTTGKASFVGEVAFGPRGQWQSIPNGDGNALNANNSFNIQNLYASYAVNDKLSLTAGYMGTFIGYEVISPLANFHYSTSYLFTNGPFQNAGLKANYKLTDKFGLMLGAFNDSWNSYSSLDNGIKAVGGQFSYTSGSSSVYFNALSGENSGTIFDLTGTFQISDKFKFGVNAANFTKGDALAYDYTGVAIYPSYKFSDTFSLGLRSEYYDYKAATGDFDVTSLTLSGNYKLSGLTIIPEFRIDNRSDSAFTNSKPNFTKNAAQFLVGAVYGF